MSFRPANANREPLGRPNKLLQRGYSSGVPINPNEPDWIDEEVPQVAFNPNEPGWTEEEPLQVASRVTVPRHAGFGHSDGELMHSEASHTSSLALHRDDIQTPHTVNSRARFDPSNSSGTEPHPLRTRPGRIDSANEGERVDKPIRTVSDYWARRRALGSQQPLKAVEPFGASKRTSEVGKKSAVPPPQVRAPPKPAPRDEANIHSRRNDERMQPDRNTHQLPNASAFAVTTGTGSMGATKRMLNGEAKPVGPHPSTINVATQYMSQAYIEKLLFQHAGDNIQDRSIAESREDSMRLQGVAWIDQVRRALQLPVRTYVTACTYYHKFRLSHPNKDYAWADATGAALLGSCKNEDTLKKSKEILAAAYNLKAGSHDALGADDMIFENHSKQVLCIERLMLEANCFDFRSKHPHELLAKIIKSLPHSEEKQKVGSVAWTVLTDLNRTFAMLKQTPQTLAVASLELAAHLQATTSSNGTSAVRDQMQAFDMKMWSVTREEVMETLLDALDLYTHHTAASILGTKYSLDDFLRIRLALNKECSESSIARHTVAAEKEGPASNGSTLKVANGHPTPVSPPDPDHQAQVQNNMPPVPEGGGTLRFMLNPQLAADEKTEVQRYFTEEWEEYDEEIEVPLPKPPRSSPPPTTASTPRDRESGLPPASVPRSIIAPREPDIRRPIDGGRRPLDEKRSIDEMRDRRAREDYRDRERDRVRDRDRDTERPRASHRERDRRYDDRRYDERYERRGGGGGSGRYDERYDSRRERR